jgi:hypothetical protein
MDSCEILVVAFTWSGPRGVAGDTDFCETCIPYGNPPGWDTGQARRKRTRHVRQSGRKQELRDLKRFLKKNSPFIEIVRSRQRMHSDERSRAPVEFWERTYEDPLVQAQGFTPVF